jgi:hypothetical protein
VVNFHKDAGCIPNKKGVVVKRRAQWGYGAGASCPADWEIWTDCLKPAHRLPTNLGSVRPRRFFLKSVSKLSGAIYHLMNRGDRREPIFKDDADRARFLKILGQ